MTFWNKLFRWITDKNYRHFGATTEGNPNFRLNLTDQEKLQLVFRNPALLKVFALQCDMFSLGKFYVYKGEKEAKDERLKKLLENPNPFQNSQEFLWEYMFWQMLGVSHMFIWKNEYDGTLDNKIYLLRPYSLDIPEEVKNMGDKIVLSTNTMKKLDKLMVMYDYLDGTSYEFEYGQLISVADLGTPISRGNYHSRVDALLKTVDNNEASTDSMNVNIRYSGKFLVAGKSDPDNVNQLPLSNLEKLDIERKAMNHNPVEAVKSMIDIKRYVDDAGAQQLDGFWLHTYYVIGSQYNIPRDVLEAYNSSTYENQEKSRGAHVAYSLMPKGELLTGKLEKHLGLVDKDLNIVLDWEHLPFMQVFAEQRAKAKKTQAETLTILLKAGVPIEEINPFLDTDFTTDETKQHLSNGTAQTTQPGETSEEPEA